MTTRRPGRLRTVFMGSDPIALPLLWALREEMADRIDLRAVYTQPDRRSGRGMQLHANAIKSWAAAAKIEVRQPERCGPDEADWLRGQEIDLVLVMAYGQILKRAFIDVPRLGTLNFHASLLPKYRGASPIHTAIAAGESETGVSLMRIVPKLDAGPVADQETVEVTRTDTAPNVIEKLSQACAPLLERNLDALAAGTLVFHEQDPERVTYCRIIYREDAELDFRAPAAVLDARIRAFQPWPGAILQVGDERMKIGSVRLGESLADASPGELRLDGERLHVQCGFGSLELLELQRPGARMLPTAAFLRGHTFAPDARATHLPMAPLVSKEPFKYGVRPEPKPWG